MQAHARGMLPHPRPGTASLLPDFPPPFSPPPPRESCTPQGTERKPRVSQRAPGNLSPRSGGADAEAALCQVQGPCVGVGVQVGTDIAPGCRPTSSIQVATILRM